MNGHPKIQKLEHTNGSTGLERGIRNISGRCHQEATACNIDDVNLGEIIGKLTVRVFMQSDCMLDILFEFVYTILDKYKCFCAVYNGKTAVILRKK